MSKISVVVPVYNESKNIKNFLKRLISTLEKIELDFEVIFALDPSNDGSDKILIDESKKNKKIKLIIFSRRFGQPSATMAAINYISGDRCVIIDCDLQDPPELILQMNQKINEGFDVVLAKENQERERLLLKKSLLNLDIF